VYKSRVEEDYQARQNKTRTVGLGFDKKFKWGFREGWSPYGSVGLWCRAFSALCGKPVVSRRASLDSDYRGLLCFSQFFIPLSFVEIFPMTSLHASFALAGLSLTGSASLPIDGSSSFQSHATLLLLVGMDGARLL